jgi:hypothetical protein
LAKSVLLILGDMANDAGWCWPSHRLLVADSEIPRRTLQRKLDILVEKGFIRVEGRRRQNAGVTSNRYWLIAPAECLRATGETDDSPASPLVTVARGGAPGPGEAPCAKGGAAYEPSLLTPVSSDEEPESAREASPEFERVFRAWTAKALGKTNHALALSAWNKAVGCATPCQLEAAAGRYLAETGGVPRAWRGLQHWLSDRDWLFAVGQVSQETNAVRFPQDEIRRYVAAKKDDDWLGSWLDRCKWDDDRKAILARSGLAVERLSEVLHPAARAALGIAIIERVPSA